MTDFNYKRLEDLIESTWRGKDEKKCLWWQGEWWSWARFAALTDDCAEKLRAAGFSKGQRLALLCRTRRSSSRSRSPAGVSAAPSLRSTRAPAR